MYNGLNFDMSKKPSYMDALGGYSQSNYDVTSAPNYAPKMQGLLANPNGLATNLNFGAGGAQPGGGSIWDSFLGKTDKNGMKTDSWGGMALGTVSGLMNAFMGMKQYGLAKKTLAHNKDVFDKNYRGAQITANAAFEDRQRARVASNAGAYESVGDYMAKNKV